MVVASKDGEKPEPRRRQSTGERIARAATVLKGKIISPIYINKFATLRPGRRSKDDCDLECLRRRSDVPADSFDAGEKEVVNALRYFKDVVDKNILEMLPGTSTAVIDTVTNIHNLVKARFADENESTKLTSCEDHMFQSLADLVRWADNVSVKKDMTLNNKETVTNIVTSVRESVAELVSVAIDKLAGNSSPLARSSSSCSKASSQRFFKREKLPQLPLSPREREILKETPLSATPTHTQADSQTPSTPTKSLTPTKSQTLTPNQTLTPTKSQTLTPNQRQTPNPDPTQTQSTKSRPPTPTKTPTRTQRPSTPTKTLTRNCNTPPNRQRWSSGDTRTASMCDTIDSTPPPKPPLPFRRELIVSPSVDIATSAGISIPPSLPPKLHSLSASLIPNIDDETDSVSQENNALVVFGTSVPPEFPMLALDGQISLPHMPRGGISQSSSSSSFFTKQTTSYNTTQQKSSTTSYNTTQQQSSSSSTSFNTTQHKSSSSTLYNSKQQCFSVQKQTLQCSAVSAYRQHSSLIEGATMVKNAQAQTSISSVKQQQQQQQQQQSNRTTLSSTGTTEEGEPFSPAGGGRWGAGLPPSPRRSQGGDRLINDDRSMLLLHKVDSTASMDSVHSSSTSSFHSASSSEVLLDGGGGEDRPRLPDKVGQRRLSDYDNLTSDDLFGRGAKIVTPPSEFCPRSVQHSSRNMTQMFAAHHEITHRQGDTVQTFSHTEGHQRVESATANGTGPPQVKVHQKGFVIEEQNGGDGLSPPPVPLKKKHIMAYMSMFGEYAEPTLNPEILSEFYPSNRISFYENTTTSATYNSQHPPILPPKRIPARERISSFFPRPPVEQSPPPGSPFRKKSHTVIGQKAFPDTPTSPPSTSPPPLLEAEDEQNEYGALEILDMLDVTDYVVFKKEGDEGQDVRGGPVDALMIYATQSGKKDMLYYEAFVTTYRSFISPKQVISKLIYRYSKFRLQADISGKRAGKNASLLLLRVVDELCYDADREILNTLFELIYTLLCDGELVFAKLLRGKVLVLMERMQHRRISAPISSLSVSARRDTLTDFRSVDLAHQMTLLDEELFHSIEVPEMLMWAKEQNEEQAPNLTRFTEHFNNLSYWVRSQILTQPKPQDREKLILKFFKVMRNLRKINNFNSYLAILSALDSAPVRRLEWQKQITDVLEEYCTLIDSSSSFRTYRAALSDTEPPCIPYLGLILQDMTFVHLGNPDILPGHEGSVNFIKRWQQFFILEHLRPFRESRYSFSRNPKIQGFFNNFSEFLSEEALWQLSQEYKPSKIRKRVINSE